MRRRSTSGSCPCYCDSIDDGLRRLSLLGTAHVLASDEWRCGMDDYNRLVFLDNQKTGSSYVSLFLRKCCALRQVKFLKHHPIKGDYRPQALYFSTVRNPVDVYVSLFRFGREKRGSTYGRLKRINQDGLYESMPRWIEFVLDEKNAPIFLDNYSKFAPLGVGLMSFRAMHITLQYPARTLAPAKSYDELIDIWSKKKIAKHIFRQEELNDNLQQLATETVPKFFDQDEVKKFLNSSERINVSKPKKNDPEIPEELLRRIKAKERFLFEQFYPT